MEDLAAVLEVELDELHPDFAFNRDNWNSLAIVSTIVLIDEQFGVAVDGEKLQGVSICRGLVTAYSLCYRRCLIDTIR